MRHGRRYDKVYGTPACFVFSSLSGQAHLYLADDIHLVLEGPRCRLRSSTDRLCAVPCTHDSVTGILLLPGHVSGTASQQTYATSTSPTWVSGMNLKRTSFLAAGVQCDILLNCAVQIALLNWTEPNVAAFSSDRWFCCPSKLLRPVLPSALRSSSLSYSRYSYVICHKRQHVFQPECDDGALQRADMLTASVKNNVRLQTGFVSRVVLGPWWFVP